MSSTKLLLVIFVTAISLFQIPDSKAISATVEVTGPNESYTNNVGFELSGDAIGIRSTPDHNTITNNGLINAGTVSSAYGMLIDGGYNLVTNAGSISATSPIGVASGISFVTGNYNSIINSGSITSSLTIDGIAGSWGVWSSGDFLSFDSSGDITASTTDTSTNAIASGLRTIGDSGNYINSGNIDVTVPNGTANGIESYGNSNSITNSDTIATTAGDNGMAFGVNSLGDSNNILNFSKVTSTTGINGRAWGVYSIGNTNIINNSGSIDAISGDADTPFLADNQSKGMHSDGDFNSITNSGDITSSSGSYGMAWGILSSGNNNVINNTGNISVTTGTYGYSTGIDFSDDNNIISNLGNISAISGDHGYAIGIDPGGPNTNNIITNLGSISAITGVLGNSYGIKYSGINSNISNSGEITATTGNLGFAYGIWSDGNSNTLTNSGIITATAGDNGMAYGITSISTTGSTLINTGTITASGGSGSTVVAIENKGILDSLTNSGTITASGGAGSTAVAIDSTVAGASIGTITNSGTIDGDINISGQDVTILGGSSSTVGALTGGTITLTSGKNLTFDSGSQLLADNIDVGTGTVINEGSLYLNSNQSITGNYAQTSASTYNTNVDGQLDVNDTATLAGTFNATGGNGINGNTRWTVMTAGNGINGTYANVTSDLDLVNFALAYDANDVYMSAQANYTSAATNQNQQAVATGLQTAFYTTPSTAGQSVLDQINPMSASQAQTAFNSLSGEGISAQQTANFSATNLIVDASRRQANYWLMDECQTKASANQPNKSRHNVLPASCASRDNKRFRSWLTGVGASDSLDGSSSMGSASVSTRTGGGVVGFDYEVSSHLLVGGMVGGTASNYNVSARSSTGTDSSGQVGLYSVAKWENFYVNSIFNYGYFSGESTRYVTGVGNTAEQTGTTSSNAFTGRMEVGYRMDHPLVNVMPFVAMQATSLQMNSFTESNTDNLGLSVAGNTTMSEPGSLGIQLDRSFDVSDKWTMYPLLRMAWVHEFQTDRSINASLQALPTSNWTVNGASAAYNAANVGISFQAMNKHGVAVFASGNAEASSTTQSYMGELGVKWLF